MKRLFILFGALLCSACLSAQDAVSDVASFARIESRKIKIR